MICTNTTAPTESIPADELIYSAETLARVTEFRKDMEEQENSLEYWQRHSDEW
jgi:hypothetical protein